jgi:signal transduction histidine kinase
MKRGKGTSFFLKILLLAIVPLTIIMIVISITFAVYQMNTSFWFTALFET